MDVSTLSQLSVHLDMRASVICNSWSELFLTHIITVNRIFQDPYITSSGSKGSFM